MNSTKDFQVLDFTSKRDENDAEYHHLLDKVMFNPRKQVTFCTFSRFYKSNFFFKHNS